MAFSMGIILAPPMEHKSYNGSQLLFWFLIYHIIFLLFYHMLHSYFQAAFLSYKHICPSDPTEVSL